MPRGRGYRRRRGSVGRRRGRGFKMKRRRSRRTTRPLRVGVRL